jgi:hypothetical protein
MGVTPILLNHDARHAGKRVLNLSLRRTNCFPLVTHNSITIDFRAITRAESMRRFSWMLALPLGYLLQISGAPGTGKSTDGLLIAHYLVSRTSGASPVITDPGQV